MAQTLRTNQSELVAFYGTTTQAIGGASNGADITTYTEVFDYGNNFSGGIFTAPYDGVYAFNGNAGVTDWASRLHVHLEKNNSSVAYSFTRGTAANNDPATTCSITIGLLAGDTMLMAVGSPDGAITLAAPSSFSGHLVARTD